MSKKQILGTIFFIVINLWTSLAMAGFIVSPLHLDFEIRQGETVTQPVRVTNTGTSQITLKIIKKDYMITPEGNDLELQTGTMARSCSKWIALQQQFEIGSGDKKKARITVSAPADASGSYWCDAFVTQISDPALHTTKKGGVNMVISLFQRWKIRIHVYVPDKAINNGRITDMRLVPASLESPPNIAVEFQNIGNTIAKCTGKLEIRNEEGETIQKISLGKNGRFTAYPESKRLIETKIEKKLPAGTYNALAIIDYGGEDLVAGEMEFEVK